MMNKLKLYLLGFLYAIPSLAFAQGSSGCIGVNHVGAFPDKPFTGEFRSIGSASNSPSSFHIRDLLARDREGRIREARLPHFPQGEGQRITTLTVQDGTTRTVTQEELNESILISDCSAGTTIQIQPGMQIARVMQAQPRASSTTSNRKYSSGYCPSEALVKPNQHLQYEELGSRELQGIVAIGCRYTTFGSETDGEWEGKPIRSDEQWVSDDLAAFLLIVRKDFKKGTEVRIELINIKLGDPEPALFKIPDGYLINPDAEQLPKASHLLAPLSSKPN